MDYMCLSLCFFLLFLLHFAAHGKDSASQFNNKQSYGPLNLTIFGPDAVTVAVPCFFVCLADCVPGCNYTIGLDNLSGEGNELSFTLRQWVSSETVTCTARNYVTGQSSTVKKTLQILEGPVNVSISGPQNLTPGETERLLCTATCKPSCNYTWVVDGVPLNGSGNEVVIRPPSQATAATLICKAINSVSGLFVTAVRQLIAPSGPSNLTIFGPDAVTVGVPCFFVCLADCVPGCNYTISLDNLSGEGNELSFTLRQWVSSETVTCTARNYVTGQSSTVQTTLQILEGPLNVSISSPPGEADIFLCSATCKPSCNYCWILDGVPLKGSGDEVVINLPSHSTSGTLICKATNSVSGLYVTAIKQLNATDIHHRSSSERVEMLPVLLFVCLMPAFLLISS